MTTDEIIDELYDIREECEDPDTKEALGKLIERLEDEDE